MDRGNVVFTSFVYAEAALVKSLLEANGIRVFMHDENTASLNPFSSSAIGGIKLMVQDEDIGRAREVLNEYREKERQESDRGPSARISSGKMGAGEMTAESGSRREGPLLSLLLDSWDKPVVFVDSEHVIRYMNKPARKTYARWGDVIGKSIFHCHNEASCRKIRESWLELHAGRREVMITDSGRHRVYMRAVRDELGAVIGYYERYEPPRGKGEETAGET